LIPLAAAAKLTAMFGKFLVTVAVVAVIWFGFQYLQRLAELQERRRARRAAAGAAKPPPAAVSGSVQDLVRCPSCGTWQTGAAARACGRKDCPY
jgi:hypothetical protein